MDRRDKPKRNILIQRDIFAKNPDMSGRITGQVQKNLLESGEGTGHIWWTIRFTKLDTPILTGQRIMEELRENLRN
jgi:hypothetical protein